METTRSFDAVIFSPAASGLPRAAGARTGLALSMLLASLGTSGANVSLPTLSAAFGASFAAVQWVVLSYLLVMTGLIAAAGGLADAVGRRRLLLGGLVLFAGASAAGALAPSLVALIAARALQGVGSAVLMVVSLASAADVFPKSGTGRAMGVLGVMSSLGTALGPSLGGLLLSWGSWRWIFAAPAPLALMAWGLVWRGFPANQAPAKSVRRHFDTAGAVLLLIALTALSAALTAGRSASLPVNAVLWLTSGAAWVGFMRVEQRVAQPLIRVEDVVAGQQWRQLAMNLLVSMVMAATLIVGPFHLERALGLGSAEIGFALSVGPLVAMAVGAPAGWLTDRFGAARVTVTGLAIMAAGFVGLALFAHGVGLPGYLIPLGLVTAGYALFQTANNTAAMTGGDPSRRGTRSGLLNLSRTTGLLVGSSAMGTVFSWATGSHDAHVATEAQIASGTQMTFAVASGLVLVASSLMRRTGTDGAS